MAINSTFITQRKSLWLLQRVEEPSQMAIMGQEMWVQISACCLYKSLWEEAMSITFLQGDSRARFLTQHGHPLPSLRLPVCLVKVFLTVSPVWGCRVSTGKEPIFFRSGRRSPEAIIRAVATETSPPALTHHVVTFEENSPSWTSALLTESSTLSFVSHCLPPW